MRVKLPPLDVKYLELNKNVVTQRIFPSIEIEATHTTYDENGLKGFVLTEQADSGIEAHEASILVIGPTRRNLPVFTKIIRLEIDPTEEILTDLSRGEWVVHPQIEITKASPSTPGVVVGSWNQPFSYQEENDARGTKGLRSPQVGALHAIHSHWVVTDDPATIVMPTGTGKTETMLSTLVSKPCSKVLVIVPTDALRTQIAHKFRSLGILKELGIIPESFHYPIVGVLKTKPDTVTELNQIFNITNVIITTINIAGQMSPELQEKMAEHCDCLFIDEAHHIAAETWRNLKEKFKKNKVLQFTATPFRNDKLTVDGKMIFKYPLRKALQNGYFKKIHFKPISEFDATKVDAAIADKAIAQLRADNPKHILMARAGTTARAQELFDNIYKNYPEFNPVQIHTGVTSKTELAKSRQSLLSGNSRIVVCVDMLGEGFDLPELKIAAFHDIRKSLAVTLQLAGRFTRSRSDLGEATFIANIADVDVRDELKMLYEQDSDWNALLEESSEQVIGNQQALHDFAKDFVDFPDDIPLRNLYPATSTAIYKTDGGSWHPEKFEKGIPGFKNLDRVYHSHNPVQNTLIIVTAKKVPVDWIKLSEVFNWDWELYILFYDSAQKLLFIHSSSNAGYYQSLAEAISGNVELVSEANVFRALHGVKRLKLYNVGLKKQLGRLISFTSHAGTDVETGISEAQKKNSVKSNLFGVGYEKGEKVSIGCSRKGRIWSRRVVNVEELTRWFSFIGKKVLDPNIDPDEVLRGTLKPKAVSARPAKVPIRIDWPTSVYTGSENDYCFDFGDGTKIPMYLLDIELKSPDVSGNIEFSVTSENKSVDFSLVIKRVNDVDVYEINRVGRSAPNIHLGSKVIAAAAFFYENPPTIWFADGSALEGNTYTELNSSPTAFPNEKIDVWDWAGINLRKESQGVTKEADSIQFKVIENLKAKDFEVIINDDGKGEAADVAAIRVVEPEGGQNYIEVNLYHCKFSGADTPGARIKDLYEVCGQAQRSAHWKEDSYRFLSHFLRREPIKRSGQEYSRFEKGTKEDMDKIMRMSELYDLRINIFIVQPGVSKAQITAEQRKILAVTESYLLETFELPFRAIVSA
jgi:superfamily II DNA or RNA helicase